MDRRRMLHAFKAAGEVGNYEDAPVLPENVDPQLHLSNNTELQPFYLVCEKDTVLGQLSGTALVRLRASSVNRFDLEPGDMLYVPAGTPHRIEPHSASVQIRYKVRDSQREGAVWTCQVCDAQVARLDWRLTDPPSDSYLAACKWFNQHVADTQCPNCGGAVESVSTEALARSAS